MFTGESRHKLYSLSELRERETAMLEAPEKAVIPKAKPRKAAVKKAAKKPAMKKVSKKTAKKGK